MAKRPTRLRFTEDDLSSDAVKKAAGKAEKAAAKAEKAVDKITPKKHRKLRQEADVSASRTAKLRFGKAKADDIPPKPSGIKRTVTHAPVDTLSANVHKSISRYEDDNVGVQTAHQTELGAETAYHIADHAVYSHKLKAYDKAEKLVSKSDKANVNALFEKFKKDNPMLLPILFHDGGKSITSRKNMPQHEPEKAERLRQRVQERLQKE